MPVEVLASPVVPHGGARVGVPSGDLHVTEVDPGVQHGRHERLSEHVPVHPREPHAGCGRHPQHPVTVLLP